MNPTNTNACDLLISIVVPCFNESEGIFRCHSRIRGVLKSVDYRAEVIYVDDGSADDTLEVLRSLKSMDPRVGVVSLSRNFGKEAALTAGIDHAKGDAIVVLDADLQDPPEYIPDMLSAWQSGYDVVAMKRADRSADTLFKRWTAACYYRLLRKLSDINIPEGVGDFRLLSRRAADALRALPERNRYMKGLFAWVGFETIEIPYKRDSRCAGESKWPLFKLVALALDGITSFSIAPLRLASVAGGCVALGALAYGAATVFKTLVFGDPVAGFPTLIVVITFLGGVQLIAVGLLGEYIGRLLVESKQRPLYLVAETALPKQATSQDASALKSQAIA